MSVGQNVFMGHCALSGHIASRSAADRGNVALYSLSILAFFPGVRVFAPLKTY